MSVKDFDQYWAEQENKPIEFKIFGKKETLPPSLPATMVLKLIRAQHEYGNKPLPDTVQMDIAMTVFGQAKLEEWAEKGLGVNQLMDLMTWVMEQYGPGNARTPKEGAKA